MSASGKEPALSPEAVGFAEAFDQLSAADRELVARLIHAVYDEQVNGGGPLTARLFARAPTDREHVARILAEFATQ